VLLDVTSIFSMNAVNVGGSVLAKLRGC
jgi:hypothetical protein